eukprot:NODE_4256_length_837_cov_6.983503_g3930_i0.p1 GENE.NODE_4256_length_837_cov_6.983503_g3930_i0~~NODE_4256_length_837_cov_6.983503_g3930_i0.p1  ORF type:complete len:278 (+),score=98.58 NODE_4256_length_837_cov_6.983503_g3930_i0:80-835(+)
MKAVKADHHVIALAKDEKLPEKLRTVLEQLERCQKALNEFLEEKRDLFPRFFFIGDDDLLEILGQAETPSVIQTHLKKLFSGINRVEFGEGDRTITKMLSTDGEVVPLVTPVVIGAEVERWLVELDNGMKETLKQLLWDCAQQTDFVKYPSQLLCLSELIHFTEDAERAITEQKLDDLRTQLTDQLTEYTSGEAEEDHVMQLKMKALILDLIHNIDVVDQLKREKTKNLGDWQWQKQLRQYFDDKRPCTLR